MEQSGTENVIYVQVDDQGRVVNYSSNMSGGEQVILLQDGGNGDQIVVSQSTPTSTQVTQPAVVKSPPAAAPLQQQQTFLPPQNTLVDQSGVPVMLVGQPQETTISQTVHQSPVISEESSVISSSGVVDQSGVPVMVLGEAGPNLTLSPAVSQVPNSTVIQTAQKPTIVHQSGTLLTKPLGQGRSLLISKQSPGSTVGSPPKTIITTSQPTVRQLTTGTNVLGPKKISHTTSSLVIKKGPGGSIVIPKPGNQPGIIVSRPITQVPASSVLVSRQAAQLGTGVPGVVRLTRPISKPVSSAIGHHVTVTQPVLTFYTESKQSVAEVSRNQAAEVSSTVNGMEESIENTSSDPIEIPDDDAEDVNRLPNVTDKMQADQPSHAQVLKDVEMSHLKEYDNKSEDDDLPDTDANKDSSGEGKEGSGKTEQDLDIDLMMYLGGGSVSEDQEEKAEKELNKPADDDKQQEFIESIPNKETSTDNIVEDESSSLQDEVTAVDEEQTSELQECSEPQKEEEAVATEDIDEKEEEIDEELNENDGVDDDNGNVSEEDFDDDDEFPAGLIRGEPIQISKGDDEVKDDLEKRGAVDDNLGDKEQSNLEVSEETQPDKSSGKAKRGRPKKSLIYEKDTAKSKTSQGVDPYMFGFEEILSDAKKKMKTKKLEIDTGEDVHKESFMAKFNLVSPKGMQKLNRRSSKRVLHAEAEKQRVDTDNEGEEQKSLTKATPKLKKKSKGNENDDVNSRQNIFELFDPTETDIPSLQAKVKKLQTLNNELKNKLRETEHKLVSNQTSNARYHEVKSMQHKIEKLEKLNNELSARLQEYEGKPSPPERTVDVSFKMGTLSFKTPGTFSSPSNLGSPQGKKMSREGGMNEKIMDIKSKEDALEKKEKKLRALDQALDMRASTYKGKESKLQRLITEIKTREQKLEFQESSIERRVKDIEYRERMLEGKTKAALEKMHKSGGRVGGGVARGTNDEEAVRSAEMKRFEQEQKDRELKGRENALKARELALLEKEKTAQVSDSPAVPSPVTPGRGRPKSTPATTTGRQAKNTPSRESTPHSQTSSQEEPEKKQGRKSEGEKATPARDNTPQQTPKGRGRPSTKKETPASTTPRSSSTKKEAVTAVDSPRGRGRPSTKTKPGSTPSRDSTPHSGVAVTESPRGKSAKQLVKKVAKTPSLSTSRSSTPQSVGKKDSSVKKQQQQGRGRPAKSPKTPKGKETPKSAKRVKKVEKTPNKTGSSPRKSLGSLKKKTPKSNSTNSNAKKTPKSGGNSAAKSKSTTRKRTRSLSPKGGRGMRMKKPKVK